MILASISSTEEKFVIQLKQKTKFMTEKKLENTKLFTKRSFYLYLFMQLFFTITKMLYKEIFVRAS
jgi:hypothetical protein